MVWNWQLHSWPKFAFDPSKLVDLEAQFSGGLGFQFGLRRHLSQEDQETFVVEMACEEAVQTSLIEGEHLRRESVQASIRRSFGLGENPADPGRSHHITPAEQGIALMMENLYRNYSKPLTHKMLFEWHSHLCQGRRDLDHVGDYRNHKDPMQILGGTVGREKIVYEAPPSLRVKSEMSAFLTWFKETHPQRSGALPPLTRAAIAHLYFEAIHPFEDGNGRIGRAIVEKSLAEYANQPLLVGISTVIEKQKKNYYKMLQAHNKTLEITEWIRDFAQIILEALTLSHRRIEWIVSKRNLLTQLKDKLNERQNKVLKTMLAVGLDGFVGGMSAEKYISITKTSRSTATRDLHEMVQLGVLFKKGELKHSRYYLIHAEKSL